MSQNDLQITIPQTKLHEQSHQNQHNKQLQLQRSRQEEQRDKKMEQKQTSIDTHLKTTQTHSSNSITLNKFTNYLPTSNCIDLQHLKQSSLLRYKNSNQYSYYGEMLNNMRNGAGIMLYVLGGLYQGNWLIDAKHGMGYQLYQNGNSYQGQYVNDKRQGFGIYKWKNGEVYEGEWVMNRKQGTGTWSSIQGDSYVGEWRNNKTHGFGVHVWSNGDRYQGYFADCLKHGFGYEKIGSGELYKGNFQRGQKSGYGEYYWADGSCYRGEFKVGKKEGKGIWTAGNRNEYYEGEYRNGKREGYGVYVWSNGIVYKGQYRQDLKDGYGEMWWPTGELYRGNWKADKQVGQLLTDLSPKIANPSDVIIQSPHEEQQSKYRIQYGKHKHRNRSYQNKYESNLLKIRFNTKPDQLAQSRYHSYYNPFKASYKHTRTRQLKTKVNRTPVESNKVDNQCRFNLYWPEGKGESLKLPSKDITINAYPTHQKRQIPHSSFYIHRINRKVKTSYQDHTETTPDNKRHSQNKQSLKVISQTKSYNLSKLLHKSRLSRCQLN